MTWSERDQLLGGNFHGVLDKVDADLFEDGSSNTKDTFTEKL